MSRFDQTLLAACNRRFPTATELRNVHVLSSGASAETWSLDLVGPNLSEALILRRAPGGRGPTALSLADEAALVQTAFDTGVPAPEILLVLEPRDELGEGYAMRRLEGETLAPRILREPRFERARRELGAQCGRALSSIHRVDVSSCKGLHVMDGPAQLAHYRTTYESFEDPHPMLDVAFSALAERLPPAVDPVLVHGDFRNGNLLVDEKGLVAVLDWELAHLGDPAEDLGWICVNSWRFGRVDKPVGGFGERQDLLQAYAAHSGSEVDFERVLSWEVFGTLKWGVMCMIQCFAHLRGARRSVEKAAIGRRVSEVEVDLARLVRTL